MDNRDVMRSTIQKADLTVAELTSNGGALLPAQAKEFFRIAIKDAALMKDITVKPLVAPTQEIDKLGFLSRIARPGVEGQALSYADRADPTTQKVTFSTKEIKCQVNLTWADLEDSVEGQVLEQTILQTMGEAFARDLEDLIINGDTNSSDALYKRLDGFLKQITSHVVDNGVMQFGQSHLFDCLQVLPPEFQKNKAAMRFYTSPVGELKWRDIMSQRAGGGGGLSDSAIVSGAPIPAYGIPVVPIPLFPTNLGTGTNETNTVLCDPKLLMLGVWKQVQIKTQEDIQAGVYMIVGRVRCDAKILHEPATAKAIHQLYI